ncbi:MAG: hypothetical protein IK137_02700 [Bacilli bacterium]|nr:hypothetical protein [Bacilli bacterium]
MEKLIQDLKELIESAKKDNDEVLMSYLNQALNHLVQKQIQQEQEKLRLQEEKKQEAIQETNKENKQSKDNEEDIEKVANGEVSKLITTKTGNHIVKSKYIDTPSHAKNMSLRTELNSVLITLALDDITKQENATKELFEIIDKYENPEDINEIILFIDNISKIGTVGAETRERIINNDRKQSYDKYFNDEYDRLEKQINILDMEYDELKSKPTVNDKHTEELVDRYQFLIHKLEKLYDETANKIDPKKSEDLKKLISNAKKQVESINKLINGLKEITDYADKAFNSI